MRLSALVPNARVSIVGRMEARREIPSSSVVKMRLELRAPDRFCPLRPRSQRLEEFAQVPPFRVRIAGESSWIIMKGVLGSELSCVKKPEAAREVITVPEHERRHAGSILPSAIIIPGLT